MIEFDDCKTAATFRCHHYPVTSNQPDL